MFEDKSDVRKCNDPRSIDYEPATLLAMENFHAFLIMEGELHNIQYGTWDTLDELRMILKRRVREEQLLTILQKALEHGDPKECALYLIEHAIPCILHLENRTLLKLLMLLLVDGWSNAKKRCLQESSHIASMKVREDMFLERVSKAMNTEILGAPGNVGQWKVPLDHSQSGERSIGQVNFENYRGRIILQHLKILIEICIVDQEKKNKWVYASNLYNRAMILLRKQSDNTDEEKKEFQLSINKCYLVLRSMYQQNIATNYWHMLSSGHILWFMNKVGCLHKYSNQGWEALNRLVKNYLDRRTNMGGGRDKTKSKLKPLASLFLRRLFWTFKLDNDFEPAKKYSNVYMYDADIYMDDNN